MLIFTRIWKHRLSDCGPNEWRRFPVTQTKEPPVWQQSLYAERRQLSFLFEGSLSFRIRPGSLHFDRNPDANLRFTTSHWKPRSNHEMQVF